MNRIESAGLTDVGRKRKINQDSLFLDDSLGLYVVADGMGGHNAGEVASRMVVEIISSSMAGSKRDSAAVPGDDSLSPEANRLLHAVYLANHEVYRTSLENEAYRGMGSTVSAICFIDKTVVAANVGDSPIYLIRGGFINEISEPHTLAAEQSEGASPGAVQTDEALNHILTRAIGPRETVAAHICELQVFKGDILVIGSDGLSNKVKKEEISKTVRTMPPREACRCLVALANERGGEDNITVLIARIESAAFGNNRFVKLLIGFLGRALFAFRKNLSCRTKEGLECRS